MLASYLGTQLPAQMKVNDANRALSVENQLARLDTSLRSAATAGSVGGVVSQPVSLGSAGAPPFAAPDGGTIGPGATGSQLTESFTVKGQSTYNPPKVGAAGGTTKGASCTTSLTSLTCSTSGHKVVWNFTSSSAGSYTITTSGGPYYINISASGSTITVTASSSSPFYLLVIGSNDTVSLTVAGSATDVHLVVVGNYDTVSFPASSWSSSTVSVLMVGSHDSVAASALSASSSQLLATFFGSYDSLSLSTLSASSSSFNAYFNGFLPGSPSTTCPVDNLAYDTDSLSGPTTYSGSGTYGVTYNDTSITSGTAPSPWSPTFGDPTISCPFYSVATIPEKNTAGLGASFLVYLSNTYSSPTDLAFDEGALVYAEAGGLPLMLVGPGINYTQGALTLWIPEFVAKVGTESGIGTAVLALRLDSTLKLALPSHGSSLVAGSSVVVSVTTPFAAAWMSYFASVPSLAGLATCAPATSAACVGPFAFNGPLATVTLKVPATSLSLDLATYSVSLN